MSQELLTLTTNGLYCAAGDFYIDPWRSVHKAIITHAHSDHAKAGHGAYLCHHLTKPLLKVRLGDFAYESIEWNQPVTLNGVKVSLHPAGHVIGSSQVRVEYNGEIACVSGDYKTTDDGLSGLFEPVSCHTFITESTFALPVYQWELQEIQYRKVQDWILANQAQGFNSVLFAYSLGKAQRMATAVAPITNNIFLHGSAAAIHEALQKAGVSLPNIKKAGQQTEKGELKNTVIIAPASTMGTHWLKKFEPYRTAVCSGWMQVRGQAKRNPADTGFAISDHADWNGLLAAIKATNAQKVLATHGFTSVLSRYLNEIGIEAEELEYVN
ncbi:MAG: ligase-associated DNA damage response exonuclease [Bacteroidetes bacterium]|nr:ligase-associated DNA damage response exonuclease [Bacteroidota bacterium]